MNRPRRVATRRTTRPSSSAPTSEQDEEQDEEKTTTTQPKKEGAARRSARKRRPVTPSRRSTRRRKDDSPEGSQDEAESASELPEDTNNDVEGHKDGKDEKELPSPDQDEAVEKVDDDKPKEAKPVIETPVVQAKDGTEENNNADVTEETKRQGPATSVTQGEETEDQGPSTATKQGVNGEATLKDDIADQQAEVTSQGKHAALPDNTLRSQAETAAEDPKPAGEKMSTESTGVTESTAIERKKKTPASLVTAKVVSRTEENPLLGANANDTPALQVGNENTGQASSNLRNYTKSEPAAIQTAAEKTLEPVQDQGTSSTTQRSSQDEASPKIQSLPTDCLTEQESMPIDASKTPASLTQAIEGMDSNAIEALPQELVAAQTTAAIISQEPLPALDTSTGPENQDGPENNDSPSNDQNLTSPQKDSSKSDLPRTTNGERFLSKSQPDNSPMTGSTSNNITSTSSLKASAALPTEISSVESSLYVKPDVSQSAARDVAGESAVIAPVKKELSRKPAASQKPPSTLNGDTIAGHRVNQDDLMEVEETASLTKRNERKPEANRGASSYSEVEPEAKRARIISRQEAEVTNISFEGARGLNEEVQNPPKLVESVPFEVINATKLRYPPVEKIKNRLFTACARAHRGRGSGQLFSNYWETLSHYVSLVLVGNTSLAETTQVLDSFLVTKQMKKLHNLLIMALLERCSKQFVEGTCLQMHAPAEWRNRIQRYRNGASQKEVGSVPRRISLGVRAPAPESHYDFGFFSDTWAPLGKSDLVSHELHHTDAAVSRNRRSRQSFRVPGALIVDPRIRQIVQEHDGMKISENALWLLIVSVREHVTSLLKASLSQKKAVQGDMIPGLLLSSASQRAGKVVSNANPTTNKDNGGNAESGTSTKVHSTSEKQVINSLDIASQLTTKRLVMADSLAGSATRLGYERSVQASFGPVYPFPSAALDSAQRYLTMAIESAADPSKNLEERAQATFSTFDKDPESSDNVSPESLNETKQRARLPGSGLGRGAKNLAALKARAQAAAKGEAESVPTGGDVPTKAAETTNKNSQASFGAVVGAAPVAESAVAQASASMVSQTIAQGISNPLAVTGMTSLAQTPVLGSSLTPIAPAPMRTTESTTAVVGHHGGMLQPNTSVAHNDHATPAPGAVPRAL